MLPTNKPTITVVALLYQNAGHPCSKAQTYLKIYPKEERRLFSEKQLFIQQNAFIWGVIIIFIKRLYISQKLDNN
jgi:hypothetical protein